MSTLSVDDQDLNDNLIVYPNPNKGEFSIKYTNGFSAGLQIDIYDIRGRSIFSKKFDNTGDFNQTIKHITIENKKTTASKKINTPKNKIKKAIII